MGIKEIFQGLIEIIYPTGCLVCKARTSQETVCSACWSKVKKNQPPFCVRCGRHLDTLVLAKNICGSCARAEYNFDRAFFACHYEGVVKELIHEFKYKGKEYLGKPLAGLMIEHALHYALPIEHIDMVIPVPLHAGKFREREFNQAQILAQVIAEAFNTPIASDILVRARATRTQTELAMDQRFANVKDSFAVHHASRLKGKNVLLIDDVMTTGATCSEAAGALKKALAHTVVVLTLAQ